MKRLIATGLVAFQILGVSAFAADTTPAPTTNTPEKALLESLIALESQNLPQSELEAQMNADLAAYSRQASAEGQQARMEQAFVDVGLFTPAQAQSFMIDSQASIAKLMTQAQASADPQALQGSVEATVNELSALHPVGAEFSSDWGVNALASAVLISVGGGISAVIVGGIVSATGSLGTGRSMMEWGGAAAGVGAISFLLVMAISLNGQ